MSNLQANVNQLLNQISYVERRVELEKKNQSAPAKPPTPTITPPAASTSAPTSMREPQDSPEPKEKPKIPAQNVDLQERAERAMNKMRTAGNARLEQKKKRRRFIDYLKSQPTSLGGKVGDLPANLQKEIAATYSKTQRAKIMDAADAAKLKGGKNGARKE